MDDVKEVSGPKTTFKRFPLRQFFERINLDNRVEPYVRLHVICL